jgi:hypothetical protein
LRNEFAVVYSLRSEEEIKESDNDCPTLLSSLQFILHLQFLFHQHLFSQHERTKENFYFTLSFHLHLKREVHMEIDGKKKRKKKHKWRE